LFGFATGSTPIGLYQELIRKNADGRIDFSKCRTVNLDEYVGLSIDHEQSYYAFMHENLFDHINIKPENTHLPNGMNPDPAAECKKYDALIHSQYPVDFVDDYDIEQGKLSTYGYSALYVTAPNLSVTAQNTIQTWVNNGGLLVMSPGAAAADEYNTASSVLHSMVGASWGAVPRQDASTYWTWRLARTAITVTNQTILGTASDETQAQLAGLTLNGATSLATLPGGLSAVTMRQYGNGYVFAFGYWPGYTYSCLLDTYDGAKLPTDWQDSARQIITAPCRYVNVPKYVACTQPLVECALLESQTNGIGITLLNWNTAPKTATFSINKAMMPTNILNSVNTAIANGTLKVTSVQNGDQTYTINGNNIDVTMTINTVDVLQLTW
jgi:hypothetical protein